MGAVEHTTVDEKENSSLLDCYRIAIDFGMPAALKAYEKIAQETADKHAVSSTDPEERLTVS